MPKYGFTDYFERRVRRDRPEIRREWCIQAIEGAVRQEWQARDQRWRFWAPVPELGGRYLRVITLRDRVTIHNAFLDRGFRP
jgi:hypothetical protein